MSKGSLFWGNGRGKLGESVFYRAGGEQRNRTYIKKIKNPKTIAQMTQRILTLNPISLFKNIKPVVSESFTERKANQSSYNKFVQENSSAKKFFITKGMLEQNMCVPYGAVIAKGSLGVNLEPQFLMQTTGVQEDAFAVFDCLFDATKVSDFSGLSATGANALSGDTLIRVLRETAVVALPTKFTLVFVEAVPQEYELVSGEVVNPWKLAYKVIHVDGNSYTEALYGCPNSSLENNLVLIPTSLSAAPSATNKGKNIGFALDTHEEAEAILHPMGVILSYEEDGALKVSNSTITSNYKNIGFVPVRGVVSAFLEGNIVYNEAMSQYGYSTGGTLNAAALAAPTVQLILDGVSSELYINGAVAAEGDYRVGQTLTFEAQSSIDMVISYNGTSQSKSLARGESWSWVIPQTDSVTISMEEEAG